MSIQLAITTFGNPERLTKLFTAFDMVNWPPCEVYVVEDPSNEVVHDGYVDLSRRYGVPLITMPEWGCMQGSAEAALEHATADWVVYWPDDALPTVGCVDNLIQWATVFSLPEHSGWKVGAFQTPYWNYQTDDGLYPGRHRDTALNSDQRWLLGVPHNPHWYGPAYYVNVNGAGFVVRREAWKAAGGFPTKTWCLDEHLSCKLWLATDYSIVTIPGPPAVHVGGMATPDMHRLGHAHLRCATNDGWLDEWCESKDSLGEKCRMRMKVEAKRTKLLPR